MSGTIIVSWPMDLWPHLARWTPHRILGADGRRMNPDQFRDRYHVAVERPLPGTNATRLQIVRTQNDAELHERLMGCALRRRKADVAKDLPPISWRPQTIEFPASARSRLRAALEAAGVDDDLLDLFDTLPPELAVREVLGRISAVSTLTRVLGEAKAPLIASALAEELSETRYAIGVLYWNTPVGDALQSALRKFGVARVEGSTSQRERQAAVDAFRRADGPRVFLGQISACGTALTLVRASRVVFTQLSWTPGENSQAAARFHRIGQTEPVDVRYVVADDTIDEAFQRVVARKSAAAAAIIENVE